MNASTASFVTSKEEAFFHAMRNLPYIRKLSFDDLKTELKAAFLDPTTEDPYSLSPTYYGLTGRRGLWLHKCAEGDTTMVFCLHPNKDDTVLIFPPFGANPGKMLIGFLENIAHLGMKMQIGRVYEREGKTNLLDFACAARGITATKVTEDTLDWTFPVHTISTDALKSRAGKHYERLRRTYNIFTKREKATVEPIDFRKDQALLEVLSGEWEAHNSKYFEGYEKKIPPDYFLKLIEIAQRPDLGLLGLKVIFGGVVHGFSIWEPPYNQSRAANLFASQVSDRKITNLGTFLIIKTAESILGQGGKFMCLGGSETPGMDEYKRGFQPHKSKQLETIQISLGGS